LWEEEAVSDSERRATEREARREAPGRRWTPEEERRGDMMRRYLGAVAAASSAAAAGAPTARAGEAEEEAEHVPRAAEPVPLPQVRDVMSVPAASVTGDTPFPEVAHTLAREQVSALPVVDAEDRVIGVVSESDLLAKAAVMATGRRPGPIGRIREHHLYDKSHGETAATLMTYPAITVHPAQLVTDAAWTAARARLKRLPVTDYHGRLVGVVTRMDLLRALVRDDAAIREEIESRIIQQELLLDPADFTVRVENGVVSVSGHLKMALIPQLLDSIREIEDVVEVEDHLMEI
jgi:CBS domain-containing protein